MKKLLLRLYHGFVITTAVSVFIHFIVASIAGGCVTPAFAARFACRDAAVIAQLALVGVIGMAFAGSAQIFEIERWSYLKQGIVHFLITALVWMPIVFLCSWTTVTPVGIAFTVIGWVLTYAVNWLVQYLIARRRIRELNRSIRAFHEKGGTA